MTNKNHKQQPDEVRLHRTRKRTARIEKHPRLLRDLANVVAEIPDPDVDDWYEVDYENFEKIRR